MKKKLSKYIKFLVSLTLILSLVAPSYASLSASDGSAFVTKAEFDSALADFNARLTTFEAGINSKIDSQVTSYLDRNGIWSGKDQMGGKPFIAVKQSITTGCLCSSSDSIYHEVLILDGQLLSNITKSGLLVATMDYGLAVSLNNDSGVVEHGNAYLRFIGPSSYSASGVVYTEGLYISRKNSGYPTGLNVYKTDGFGMTILPWVPRDPVQTPTEYYRIMDHHISGSYYTFVSAGDRLRAAASLAATCGNSGQSAGKQWPEATSGICYSKLVACSVY